MMDFIEDLRIRNEALFYFGLVCFSGALLFLIFTKTTNTQLYGVNAWYKPFKFAVSIGLYAWTMAWYCHYLPSFRIDYFNWATIILLGFEIVYITIQAGRGLPSHYNLSSPVYSMLYVFMALAATLITLYTAYIGFLFFTNGFPDLPNYYLWAIRLGILIFVIFSFEGFAMGSRLNHSVGAINDNSDWFILGWSKKVGDLRVAHFIGMHALQTIPIFSYYILKNTKATIALSVIYALLAVFTLIQALEGKPILKGDNSKVDRPRKNKW